LYLGNSAIASSYGAAGSLVVILVWIYYSAQILLFGAEFTRLHAAPRNAVAAANEQR
jgi:membrane protein